MKFLVNSNYLAGSIKAALESHCREIETTRDTITFYHETCRIDMTVHSKERMAESIPFDRISWYRLMKLMKSIPEQPITVSISYTSIEVWCEHVFKNIEKA